MSRVEKGEIWHRDDFGTLCEWRMLHRLVEIGVDRGEFGRTLVSRCQNCTLYLGIDPYAAYNEMFPFDRVADIGMAVNSLSPYSNKAKLIRTTSHGLAEAIKSGSIDSRMYTDPYDFVYVDGSHSEEDVYADCVDWWDLISEQGILAGHDWSMMSGVHPGVQRAVRRFAKEKDRTIYLTYKDDPTSWYIYKNGKPGADWTRLID